MKINLFHKERLSVFGISNQADVFIHITPRQMEDGLEVDLNSRNQYIEIRSMEGQTRMFLFKTKRAKKDADLGFWNDAEVIFALNQKS